MTTATINESVADDELYEVIDGIRVRQGPMGIFAVWIASDLFSHLAPFARTANLGRTVSEALFHMPAPTNCDRRPDLAFVSYERWPKNRPIPRKSNAWDVVPNLAVEVVSPNDTAEELDEKISEFLKAGVELVWVVYPQQSRIYVHQSPTQISALTLNDTLDGGTVLPGFRLALAELFSEPAETDGTIS